MLVHTYIHTHISISMYIYTNTYRCIHLSLHTKHFTFLLNLITFSKGNFITFIEKEILN